MAQKQPVVWADSGEGSVQFSTRVSASLRQRVKIAAFKSETQLSEWIAAALVEHLERSKAAGKEEA
jgi:predicted HicB family RNase H-like nuclease